jgi:hypothetical protein
MEGGAALTLEEGDGPTDLDHHGCQHHSITTTIAAASASSHLLFLLIQFPHQMHQMNK